MKQQLTDRLTDMTLAMKHSFIREILKVTKGVTGIISLAGGLPSPESFPKQLLAQLFADVITNEGDDVLQYGTSDGDKVLKQFAREHEDITYLPDNEMIITLGATNSIYIYTRCLIEPGDTIICEAPSFPGSLTGMEACGAKLVGVEMDDWGMNPGQLRDTLNRCQADNQRVKFIYLIPEFQNPTGKTMNMERRRKIIELALEFDTLILEDIPYRELRYSGQRLTSLWEMARSEYKEPNLVTSTKSFSKILGPGLRLGMAVGAPEIISRMVMWAEKSTVSPDCVSQRVAARFLQKGYMKTHIEHILTVYQPRLQTMLDCLDRYMPEHARWTKPEGGMFLWVTLPNEVDTSKLFDQAIANKVAFIPGNAFYPSGSGKKNEMRLNFSYPSLAEIEAGVKRLGDMLKAL